jgi:hypothetical protein
MATSASTSAAIIAAVTAEYRVQPQDLTSVALTSRFAWLVHGELVWLKGARASAVVYAEGDAFRLLNAASLSTTERLQRLSVVFDAQRAAPGSLDAVALAKAVRMLTIDPRGYLADANWWRSIERNLASWLLDRTVDESVVRMGLREAQMETHGGDWQLTFRWVNHLGGMEDWVVSGTRATVAAAQLKMILANGSIRIPVR